MQGTDHDRLCRLALDAIEEAAAAAHLSPVPQSRALALALAWLLRCGKEPPCSRWPFESFWEGLTSNRKHDRWSEVNAAVNAIYLELGIKRELKRISHFERLAKER